MTSIQKLFFHSLKRGTGEAYLIIKDHPEIDFSSYIIKGALKNYAYDGQCESSRAPYLFKIISLSSKKEQIRRAVLKGLATEVKDTWTLTQLFDLAKIYVQMGYDEARKAIYSRFFHNCIEGSEWVGYYEIIELDGLNGLLFIANTIGKFLEQNPDDWQDDLIIKRCQDQHPAINILEELENAAKQDKYIQIYLSNIRKTHEQNEKYERPIYSFELFKKQIDKGERAFLSPAFIKNFTPDEIRELADKFLVEEDPSKKEKYLRVFNRIKFPYDFKLILELAKCKRKGDSRLVEFAVDALKHFKAVDIRTFAIKKLHTERRPEIFTDLLINNYSYGDASLLKAIVERTKSADGIEALASSYVDIYKNNKTAECAEPLLALYRKMNCGIHRNSVVETLIGSNALPDRINDEIAFDSDEATRKLHKNIYS